MNSPTMAYWYALHTGMQKQEKDDCNKNRSALQVYQWWAGAMAAMTCAEQWEVWRRQQGRLRQC
jgi:hypothetical protein